MASKTWVGSVSGNPATAGNWEPSGVPADADDIIFDGHAEASMDGADQSTIEPATIRIYNSFTFAIGTSAVPWKIGPVLLEIGLQGEGGNSGSGPTSVVIDCTADAVNAIVHNANSEGADGESCIMLRGTDSGNTLTVKGGSVGIGTMVPGEATTWAAINVSGSNSVVTIGYGATLTLLNIRDGVVLLNSACPTINLDSGSLETHGSGTSTTIECRGGVFTSNSTGTITTLAVSSGGVADFSLSPANRTVTNCTMTGSACRMKLDNNAKNTGSTVVTFTNGIDLLKGAKSDQVQSPTDLTISFSSL